MDIVAFVTKGDFPRSRLGEKQRGKILAGWVTRKMRTLAQFAIRDLDAESMPDGGGAGELIEANRASMTSVRSSGIPAAGSSSLRNVEHAPQILEQEEFDQHMDHISHLPPPGEAVDQRNDEENTPTGYPPNFQHNIPQIAAPGAPGQLHYAPGNDPGLEFSEFQQFNAQGYAQEQLPAGQRSGEGQLPPQIRLPGVDGRENFDSWPDKNRDQDEEDWTAEAIMHMNLAGDMNPR